MSVPSKPMLNLEMLHKIFSDSYAQIEKSEKQKLILVIGNTGAGKSTSVNYLIGHKLRRDTDKKTGKKKIEVEIEDTNLSYAKIGQTTLAETLYPGCYLASDSSIVLCDCPGFEDNRPIEFRVCVSLNLELAVKMSKEILGIIVVLNYQDLENKCAEFCKTCKTLMKLFIDPEKVIPSSSIFLFTRVPCDIQTEHIHNTIKGMIDDLKNIDQSESAETKEICEMINFLTLLSKYKENYYIIDVFDKGESRKLIHEAIVKLKSISIDSFQFSNYSEPRTKFQQAISRVCKNGIQLLQNRETLPKLLEETRKKREEIMHTINSLDIEKDRLQRKKDRSVSKEFLEKKIKTVEEEIGQLKKKKIEIETEFKNYNDTLFHLNSSKSKIYLTETYKESRAWYGLKLGWSQKIFYYDNPSIPFCDIKEDCKGGKLTVHISSPGKGLYKATYESDRGADAYAQITVFIEERNDPSNRALIEIQRDLIKDTTARINKVDDDIKESKKELQDLILNMNSINEGSEHNLILQKLIQDFTEKKDRLGKESAQLPKEGIIKQNIEENDKEIENNKKHYDNILKIKEHINIDSLLVDKFANMYRDYITK